MDGVLQCLEGRVSLTDSRRQISIPGIRFARDPVAFDEFFQKLEGVTIAMERG